MEQQAYLGTESIHQLLPILRSYHPKRIFLVRGKNSYSTCGAKKIMNEALAQLTCHCADFFDFSENPKVEDVEQGLQLLLQNKAEVIVAIGGGSVLDMAKLIRFFYSYSGEITGNTFVKQRELLPLIALPTTSGTGAEATHFSVVYKDKVKYSVEHDDMLPDYAIIYPQFTYSNPKYLTACTGFDALAQAIEAYWNKNANEESDKYAVKAIQLLWDNLPLAVNTPTDEARDNVSEGSYWAGRAINITKTTAPHAFSYPFTCYYGYPHGHAVALTFPYFAGLNIEKGSTLEVKFEALNIRKNTDWYSLFAEYTKEIGLIHTKEVDWNLILKNVNLNRLKNNPVEVKDDFQLLNKIVKEIHCRETTQDLL
ncbi:MAG: phosphonoacetaldehyde reductase [Mediterranea massiliensis]|nr:phosphonoacetaldehyde reductase [Mediterranea massiliensis]